MARQSLVEYFQPESRPSDEVAVVWRRGYRLARWTYQEIFRAAAHFSLRLQSEGLVKGERVLLWGENSGQWVAAFLGCLFCGAVVVPMDAVAEKGFARRVAGQAGVRLAILGRGLPPLDLQIPTLVLDDLEPFAPEPARAALCLDQAKRDDPVEIVFTSGTTAEPRGVVLTHGNALANLEPIEREIKRYRRYERFVHPLRLLDLLPLSHVFGQLLGIFLPQILGATSVFIDTLNPSDIIGTVRDQRVSLLVAVPRLLESLKDRLEQDLVASGRLEEFERHFRAAEHEHFLRRWWRFRRIRRRFGWKFWAIVSGGATLSPQTEAFWSRLGYAVIQGYGLTETTSLVSINHPFRLGRGSIGKALPGLEVKLADDGEILVRGENVARDYWQDAGAAPVRGEDGWFHTGDLGERDAAGNLYFRGRSKNVIVTPEGLNVFPQDLEAELRSEPGVRDAVVVGIDRNGNAEPCAVLLLREASDPAGAAGIIERANTRLAPFQQMRHWMIWPGADFPRTPTLKPILGEIRTAIEARLADKSGRRSGEDVPASRPIVDLLARVTGSRGTADGDERLHLTSIERVELLSALEDRYQVDLSETAFANAQTASAIERLLEQPAARAPLFHYPRWAQDWRVNFIRALVFHLLARPAMFLLGWPYVSGRENLADVEGPLLVVANHVTFLDSAYVLEALPGRLRHRLAVAMDGELLESMRNPGPEKGFFARMIDRASYWLVVSVYNVFPLPMHAGFRKSFAFAGDLIGRGWNVLIFPEGMLSRDGRMSRFRPGIGLLAAQLQVPVVPVYLDGLFELKTAGRRWAPPGRIKVAIGGPGRFGPSVPAEEVAQNLERRVAALGAPEDASP